MSLILLKRESVVLRKLLEFCGPGSYVELPIQVLKPLLPKFTEADIESVLEVLHSKELIENLNADCTIFTTEITAEGRRYFEVYKEERRIESIRFWREVGIIVIGFVATVVINLALYVSGLADLVKGIFS